MLVYTCPTCQRKFDCDIDTEKVVYFDGNKRLVLTTVDEDCDMCVLKIQDAIKAKRAEIKALRQQTT